MVDLKAIGHIAAFIHGTNGYCTDDLLDKSKPFVARGVAQRKQIRDCIENNRDYYYIDTGYFGNYPSKENIIGKKLWMRVVKNEMQLSKLRECPTDRWESLVAGDERLKWRGWKSKGNRILLVMPNPKACLAYGFDIDQWKDSTIQEIKKHTDMEIEVRYKQSRDDRKWVDSIYDAFDRDIYATVTFNSIAALESVLYGIPAFSTVPCAATPLISNDLSSIMTPYKPREDIILSHCYSLAYGQFTVEELYDGTAWNILKKYN